MATIAAAAGGVDGAPADLRLTPETYTTIGTLLDLSLIHISEPTRPY